MLNFLKEYFSNLETSGKWMLGFALLILSAPKLAIFSSLAVLAYYGYDLFQKIKSD
jgi:hypothetical protein